MALSLTCVCGARFEVEDTLAGQEVSCPECQQPLRAPALQQVPLRTSGYALASAVLVLVGAFTVVGTVIGIGLGVTALVSIARHRDRLAGTGFAVFGIVAGVLFTGLTALALSNNELFGLDAWMHSQRLGAQVDTSGPLEISLPDKGFAITRPSPKWGRVWGNQVDDDTVGRLQEERDLLLAQPARYAFVDVRVIRDAPFLPLDQCDIKLQGDFGGDAAARPESDKVRPPAGNVGVREMVWQVRRGRRQWTFLVRLYKKTNGPLYIVRGYTLRERFSRAREELDRALTSFRALP